MADEKDDETTDEAQAPEVPASDQAPEASAEAPEAQALEASDAEASAQPEAEAPAEPDAGAVEAEASGAGAPAPVRGGGAQPAEQGSPKEIRRRKRSKHAGEARPARSPEERHAERVAERRTKAARRSARRLQERAKAAARRAATPAQEPLAPIHPTGEGTHRERQGIVVSDRAAKTITVRIDTARRHRRYEKIVRSSSTLHAHDENNDARIGDVVRVIESRPLSKTKRWKLLDVLERAR